jgi:hypothetical protein
VFKPSLSKNAFLAVIMLTLFLMFVAFTIQYVNNLKKEKCECSKEITRDIIYIYSWIMVVVICLVVLTPIIIMSSTFLLVKS